MCFTFSRLGRIQKPRTVLGGAFKLWGEGKRHNESGPPEVSGRVLRRLASLAVPLTLAILFLSASSIQTLAQQTPGPEHQRLGNWVGEWTYVSGDASGTFAAEWLGDFFVQIDEVYTDPSGNTVNILGVFGYDAEEEVYTWHRYWSSGYSDAAKGWVHDNTRTFLFDEPVGENARMTMIEESADVIAYKWEVSVEGGPWEVTSEGRSTKVR